MTAITIEDLIADAPPLTIAVPRRSKRGELTEATLKVWVRRPTDIEHGLVAGAANGARRALRAKLADEKSEEHNLLLREHLDSLDDAGLRQLWIQGNLMERFAQVQFDSLEEREYIPEPEGDVVPAADRDAHEVAVERAESDRTAHLIAALNSIRSELEREAEVMTHEVLIKSAIPAHIETLVQGEWERVYFDHLVARCTFSDAKHSKPAFKTTAQVSRLRIAKPAVFEKIVYAHKALAIHMEPDLGN